MWVRRNHERRNPYSPGRSDVFPSEAPGNLLTRQKKSREGGKREWRVRMKCDAHIPLRGILTATLLFAALAAPTLLRAQARPVQNQAQNSPAGNAQKGKDAFSTHMCATCHGPQGQGAVGPAIAPPPRAFGDFARYIRIPAGKMPPFAPQAVSDADLADIYAFLQSANPAPPSNLSALAG